MCVRECLCERKRERDCVFVCVRERVCVCVRERERVCVCERMGEKGEEHAKFRAILVTSGDKSHVGIARVTLHCHVH